MIIPLDVLLVLLVVPGALWYLGSRATITQPLWSRYPKRVLFIKDFPHFMDCAACTGFWWGCVLYVIGFSVEAIPEGGLYTAYTAPLFGFVTLITTPLIARLHDLALYGLGSITAAPNEQEYLAEPFDGNKVRISAIATERLGLHNDQLLVFQRNDDGVGGYVTPHAPSS